VDREAAIAEALQRLLPKAHPKDRAAILDQALHARGLRGASTARVAWLSTVAYARHMFTDYDALLEDGYDRDAARHFTLVPLNDTLAGWGSKERVSGDAEAEPEDEEAGEAGARQDGTG
jgi:hypothetical protein